jgi:hypothetical protein
MRLSGTVGVVIAGLTILASDVGRAQTTGPVAVPIVGSPAAQGATQPSVPAPAPTVTPAPTTATVAGPSMGSGERKLQLSVKDGLVTLVAQNVTVREILGEWQRRTGCQFVNAERLAGGPVTFEFPGRPELEVIDSLLRGSAGSVAGSGYGYIVGPRTDGGQSGSLCGAVYILPTSHPTSTAGFMPSGPAPVAAPLMTTGSPDDEIPPVSPIPGVPPQVQPRPGQPLPGMQQPGQNVNPSPQTPGGLGGAVAPTAPGAGRIGVPATPTPAPTGGRGGH